ncbi:MAG: hypothetical protein NC079_00680 [Clostridium sp.]|nr:hypothetical protein [Acetatifactor muris]MCM1527448.1 hypothetical protein [Bacteroides sp.]MCM1562106.1 hypothetical protein [Clostridium sp.]
MARFENEFSSFPSRKIIRHEFKNVDDGIAEIVRQINDLRAQGLYDRAARIIEANRDILSHYIVDAVTFRTWEEEIYNTQKYARQKQQTIWFDEYAQDFDGIEGDVWLGGV